MSALNPLGWRPNLRIAVGLAVLCAVMALATGFWLLFRLVYLLAFAIPLAWLWTRSMINELEVDVVRRTQRVTQGQPVTGRVALRSTSRIPKVWLEVEDPSDLPGHVERRFITLGGRELEAWTYSTPTSRRGVFTMGPITVAATDPFGMFRMTRTFGDEASVLVYPSAPELPSFYVPPANLPGDGRYRRRTHNITPNAAGIRQYAPGDAVSRVHWPATARTGQLMVKLFELDPASDLWLMLDMQRDVHVGEGTDGTEEAAVTAAASIARTFIAANRSVGLALIGPDLDVTEPDRGQNQYTRILESLAMARAAGDVPLDRLLLEESRRFGRHTTVVAITPSTEEAWPLTLMSLGARGVQVAAVLLEAETYGGTGSALDTYGTLAAGGVFTYTIKRADDLARVLGTPGAGAEPAPPAPAPPDDRWAR